MVIGSTAFRTSLSLPYCTMRTSATPVEISPSPDVAYGFVAYTERPTSRLSSQSPFVHVLLLLLLFLPSPVAHSEAGGRLKEAVTPLASAGELWRLDAASVSHGAFLLTLIASCGDFTLTVASPTTS